MDGHTVERGVEAGREVPSVVLLRRRGESRHGGRRLNSGAWCKNTRAPGVEWPRLDNTLPGVVGGRPLWRWRGVATGRRWARTVVRLALLATVAAITTVGGRDRRCGRGRGRSRCRLGGVVMRRKKGRLGLHLQGMLDAVFLLQKIRLGVEERRRRIHGGEDGDRLTELVVQSAKGVDDESRVGDCSAAIIESVGEALETAVVLTDRHVALVEAVELLLSVHGALKTVVEELTGDGAPGGVGGVLWPVDVAPDVLRHGGVEPLDNAGIHLQPFWVVDHGDDIDGAINMADETEFLEGEGEEGSPLAKVAIIHVESDGNMVMNIEEGEGGGLGRGGLKRCQRDWSREKHRSQMG